jgi:antitoxin ParD1/3/4
MPRSFALGNQFETLIDTQVQEGRYNNASEVVRDALRLLEDREALRKHRLAELRGMAEQGRFSGLSDQGGDEFPDRMEVKYRKMANAAS